MESSNILASLYKSTDLLTSVTIQDVMRMAKRPPNDIFPEFWEEIAHLLWNHLYTTFGNIDDQLLCSTSFYSVIIHLECKEKYLNKIKETIEAEWFLRRSSTESEGTLLVVSLMYGLFQSSFLTNVEVNTAYSVESLLKVANDLLMFMAYEYTQYTFIVFKTVKSYQKMFGNSLQQVFFYEENVKHLLNMINHNWENPIPGIRDMCKEIFQLLLSVMEVNLCQLVTEQVNGFYWNKAKFFMLAGIVKHKLVNSKDELRINLKLNEGLFLSLHKPGLVSAGADMYFEILKKLKSSDEWYDIFLEDTLAILTGLSKKAIENYNNYWYLATLKMFPDINRKLLQELETKKMHVDCKLHSTIFVMKQANKLGVLEKNWEHVPFQGNTQIILHSLVHWDTATRLLAFEIICVSNRKLDMTKIECDLVVDFLKCNVNSDCTVLRQSMLSSLTCFLIRFHKYYFYKHHENMDLAINFSSNLNKLIIESLNYNGNYQRKLTTAKIFQIIYNTLNDTFKSYQKQVKNDSLKKSLKYYQCWLLNQKDILCTMNSHLKDPADDVRQLVAQVLLDQSENISQTMLDDLIKTAREIIKSKFFFDVDCGLNQFKLIANILVSKDVSGDMKNVKELFDWGFQCLIESHKLRQKPVDAIFEGKQMHPYISLILIVLQVCQNKTYDIKLSHDRISKIIEILEDISKQFGDEGEVGISTDFAQMNNLVEKFIENSSYASINRKTYDGQITGLHKLVLNSLWLNVKASCELATYFIIYFTEDNITICRRSLKLIMDVLETSRHKGAIEAAGLCLGQAIKHLSMVTGNSHVSKLPYELLECKLQEWITEANKMASVTRRGAGMSIMVHRIVSNDMQKGKPLFHFFMKKLLEVCYSSADSLTTDNGTTDRDLPKAIFIHFFTKIVIDSGLAAHTLYYSTELAEIAFDNLTNKHWQIRNAALQLYGALLPKLIGQKKASGSDEESVATVAVDEFRNHFPKLWNYIRTQLIEHKRSSLEADSNLIPLLNLLASLAKRYTFSFECEIDRELLNALINKLSSPIFVVRRLTALSIYKIYTYEDIYELLINQQFISENQLHGNLLLVQNYCNEVKSNKEHFNRLHKKLNGVLSNGTHSYLNREIYDNIFPNNEHDLKVSVNEMYRNNMCPGVHLWIYSKVKLLLSNSSWNKINANLKIILILNDSEVYLDTLSTRLLTKQNQPKKNHLLKTAEILLSCKKKYDSFGLWKVLYSISENVYYLGDTINFPEIMQSVKCINQRNRFLLPLMARSAEVLSDDNINFVVKSISIIIDCNSDEELKYIAATANNEMSKHIALFNDETKLDILLNAVKFLQDEDEGIRNVSVDFLKITQKDNYALNPFICLVKILHMDFIQCFFTQPELAVKRLKLTFTPQISDSAEIQEELDDNNPFANESPNIYAEPKVIRKLVDNLIV